MRKYQYGTTNKNISLLCVFHFVICIQNQNHKETTIEKVRDVKLRWDGMNTMNWWDHQQRDTWIRVQICALLIMQSSDQQNKNSHDSTSPPTEKRQNENKINSTHRVTFHMEVTTKNDISIYRLELFFMYSVILGIDFSKLSLSNYC